MVLHVYVQVLAGPTVCNIQTTHCRKHGKRAYSYHHKDLHIDHIYLRLHDKLRMYMYIVIYSSPSLSGHSQQRPPSLMWPQIFCL